MAPGSGMPVSGLPASGDLAQVAELVAASKPLPGGWLGQQLQRLQRLLALRDAHLTHLNDEGRRLLDHAIFTTFVDCRELGGEVLASALLTPMAEDAPAGDGLPADGAPEVEGLAGGDRGDASEPASP